MKKVLSILAFSLFTFHFSFSQCPTCPIDTIKGKAVYLYEVQKGEGLFRISQNFGVSQEEILKLNPVLQNSGLKLGQKIRIPVAERIDSTQYIVHVIQPKETLYGLSKQYGVRISDLQELNPETAYRMPIGGKLLIKKQPGKPIVKQLEKRVEAHVVAPVEVKKDTVAEQVVETVPIDSMSITETPIRLAFMLPFQASSMRRTVKENRFIEFYEGALLAIYEAQEQGQTFEIYTYDTEKSEDKVHRLLNPAENPEIQLVDAVIGPTYTNQVAACYDYALTNHTYFLFPFADKVSNLQTNPYLLQFNLSDERKRELVADTTVQVSMFKTQLTGDTARMHYKILRNRYFTDEIEQQNPRYDLLGYDLTCYLIKLLQAKAAKDDFDVSTIIHKGVQSDLHFMPVAPDGGYQNIEIQVLKH